MTTAEGKVVSYTYNGDNLLYERTENSETTRYYYDGGSVIAEATVINGVAELKQRYIRGRGLVANEDPYFNKAYYLHNGHGDVEQLRDETGNTRLNNYTYDIWGNPVIEEETDSDIRASFGMIRPHCSISAPDGMIRVRVDLLTRIRMRGRLIIR